MGSIQLELLQQHCDNPSACWRCAPPGRPGLQHLTWFADDLDREGERLRRRGFDEVMTASLPVMGGMRIARAVRPL